MRTASSALWACSRGTIPRPLLRPIRFSSTTPTSATPSSPSNPNRQKRPIDNTTKYFLLGGVFFMLLGTLPGFQDNKSYQKALNPDKFLSYTIDSKERASPNSFLMTLRPEVPAPKVPLPYIQPQQPSAATPGTWLFPLWSVQVKQPEIQIVREYTPLPPSSHTEALSGVLRLLIRVLPDGEVSRYLDRQLPASQIELRGPYPTLLFTDAPTRADDDIVFIAAGSAVAPALQAAHALLSSGTTPGRIRILWAVHSRADIDSSAPLIPSRVKAPRGWFSGVTGTPELVDVSTGDVKTPTLIAETLRALKMQHGDRFDARVAITGEEAVIDEQEVKKALGIADAPVKRQEGNPGREIPYLPAATGPYAEHQPKVVARPGGKGAYQLVIVSGPDGFVERYAGRIVQDNAPAYRRIRKGGMVDGLLDKYGGNLKGEWQVVNLD